MSTLKHIKSIKSSGNSLYELIKYFLYGLRLIEEYDPDKVYHADDIVTVTDPVTGEIQIYICNTNGATGPFDEDYWDSGNLYNMLRLANKNTIVLDTEKPASRFNRMWLQPLEVRDVMMPEPEQSFNFEKINLVFSDEFPVVEDPEVDDGGSEIDDLLFDEEGLSDTDPDNAIFKEYEDGIEMIIDTQEEVEIDDDSPTDKTVKLWIDTDLSDDNI